MKWLAALMAFLVSCAYNKDNSVQIGDYRIAHDPSCMGAGVNLLWYVVIPVLICICLVTYIRNHW